MKTIIGALLGGGWGRPNIPTSADDRSPPTARGQGRGRARQPRLGSAQRIGERAAHLSPPSPRLRPPAATASLPPPRPPRPQPAAALTAPGQPPSGRPARRFCCPCSRLHGRRGLAIVEARRFLRTRVKPDQNQRSRINTLGAERRRRTVQVRCAHTSARRGERAFGSLTREATSRNTAKPRTLRKHFAEAQRSAAAALRFGRRRRLGRRRLGRCWAGR